MPNSGIELLTPQQIALLAVLKKKPVLGSGGAGSVCGFPFDSEVNAAVAVHYCG